MTLVLIIKILGGLLSVGAHAALVRAASDISSGWWFSSRFIPGATILFALLYLREMWSKLLVLCLGGLLIGSAYGLAIYQRVDEARQLAKAESEGEMYEEDDDGETLPPSALRRGTQPDPQVPVIPVDEVPRSLRPQLDALMKRYASLQKERAALKLGDSDAIRSFNIRAEDYRIASEAFRKELR